MQQQALINNGVRYYGPENLRRPERGLGDVFGLEVYDAPPKPRRSRAEQTEFMFKDGDRLILSDENFVGVLHDKHGHIHTPLYPYSAERVSALATAIDSGPLELFVGLRNPASFLSSAYSQALLGGRQITFADYLDANPLDQVFWAGWIARLRSAAGVGHVTVWLHEEYHQMFRVITRAMTGSGTEMRVVPIEQPVHVGLSARAIDHVVGYAGADDLRDVAAAARAAYPTGSKSPAFDPFDDVQKAAAQADYDNQIAQIGQIDGVTVLRP